MQESEPQLATIVPDEAPVVRMSTRDGGRRVLVLDDNDLVRQTVVRVLRQHGYEAHAAATGADALVLLQEFTFGLMYCDVRLQDESGIDLLPVILAVAPRLPVVMVSGVNESTLAVDALRAGAVDYVTKPLETKRFLAMTERLLGQFMMRDHSPLLHPVAAAASVGAVEVQHAAATRQLVQIVDKLVSDRRDAPAEAPSGAPLPARRAPLIDRDPPIPLGPALIVLPPPRRVPWRVRVSLTLRRFGFRRGVPIAHWAA
jgi:DNA-binding response OmpR family regulator